MAPGTEGAKRTSRGRVSQSVGLFSMIEHAGGEGKNCDRRVCIIFKSSSWNDGIVAAYATIERL
jgi:hypothetical protein